MGAPVLFIHYRLADYLRWTLECARFSNSGKQIVFLGDATNKQFARGVADFMDFDSLTGTQKELEFQRVFQVIQGDRHRFNKANGVEFWLKGGLKNSNLFYSMYMACLLLCLFS